MQPKFIMIICFDIGGSAIKCAIALSAGEIRQVGSVATPLHDLDQFVHAIAGLIDASGASAEAPVAIAITGVVDASDIIKVANIPCIDGLQLRQVLAEALGRKVSIVNDADAFALAEAAQGAGQGQRIVFGAILGTGVGGGLVIDGRLVRGAGGFAGEWGHGPLGSRIAGEPPVVIPSLACGCGQAGCVDTLGGARGLEKLHAILHGTERTSRDIIAAWEAGDPVAERTLDVFIELSGGAAGARRQCRRRRYRAGGRRTVELDKARRVPRRRRARENLAKDFCATRRSRIVPHRAGPGRRGDRRLSGGNP